MRVRTHPGEVLRCEFLEPLGLSARALAEAIDVPANRISEIVREHRGMTADTALRLGKYFSTTPEFWMNLQTAHDLSLAAKTTSTYLAAHDENESLKSPGIKRSSAAGAFQTVKERSSSKSAKEAAASILTDAPFRSSRSGKALKK